MEINQIIHGDCFAVLKTLPMDAVQCCVTSPPYWGMRDYGIDGQMGLEKTPGQYLEKMVAVFREIRRVLRKDGTAWVNMGDGYASSKMRENFSNDLNWSNKNSRKAPDGFKHKDLIGMPWRVAFALQADGWYLRSDIIWHKPNPMPESVSDRPTKAHEYIFLLTKNSKYYYDGDAIKEPAQNTGGENGNYAELGRNKRTVWTIPTAPYPGAHYATFPPKLPEICIKAGTSEKGACPECGAPWERLVEYYHHKHRDNPQTYRKHSNYVSSMKVPTTKMGTTTGWRPTCDHNDDPIPCTVLDPFNGHGTTGLVAARLNRSYIGIEINEADCKASKERIEGDNPLFNKVVIK